MLLLSLLGLLLIAIVVSLVIKGAVWLTETVEPLLVFATKWSALAHLLVLLPLSIPRSLRSAMSIPIGFLTLLYAVTAALKASVVLYSLWGLPGWLLGAFMGGVGIFPAGMVAAAMNGSWGEVGIITLLLVLMFLSSMHLDWVEE